MSPLVATVLNIAVLVVYVLASLSGLTLLKSSSTPWSWHFFWGIALYGGGFLIWIAVILRSMPLSIAFPIAAGALMVGSQAFGWWFLNERISTLQFVGIGLILVGLTLVYSTNPSSQM